LGKGRGVNRDTERKPKPNPGTSHKKKTKSEKHAYVSSGRVGRRGDREKPKRKRHLRTALLPPIKGGRGYPNPKERAVREGRGKIQQGKRGETPDNPGTGGGGFGPYRGPD